MISQVSKKLIHPSYFIAISVVCFFVLYYKSIEILVLSWKKSWNSHGILLAIVCSYLFYKIWMKHKNKLDLSFSVSAYILLFALSVLWLFANLTFVEYVELISLPIILVAIFISLLGWHQSRVFWFPILLMLLSGPLLSVLVPVLQDITAVLSGLALEMTGITNLVDGVLILVPAGTFEVDTGCSGLNVVTVGVILSLIYANINHFRLKEAAVLVVVGVLAAIFSNIIRVYIIIIVGNATNMQHALVKEHGDLGWIVFSVVFGVFIYFVHRYWSQNKRDDVSEKQGVSESASQQNSSSVRNNIIGGMLSIFLLSAGPLLLLFLSVNTNNLNAAEKFSTKLNGIWEAVESKSVLWRPVYRAGKGDYKYSQVFTNDQQEQIYLDLRYFARQSAGDEAINSTNSVYDRASWTRVYIQPYTANIEGHDVFEETLIRGNNNQEMLVWRWYVTAGVKTGNQFKAKIYNLYAVLTGEPEIATYIVATAVNNTYEHSRKNLEEFITMTLR